MFVVKAKYVNTLDENDIRWTTMEMPERGLDALDWRLRHGRLLMRRFRMVWYRARRK